MPRKLSAWAPPMHLQALTQRAAPLLPLLLTILATTATASWYPLGLDAAMAQQQRSDPVPANDTLLSLPNSLRKALSRPSHATLSERVSYLRNLEWVLPLHVKLVGFAPEERRLLQAHMPKYVDSIRHDEHPAVTAAAAAVDTLAIASKLVVHIAAVADPSLAGRLGDSIGSAMASSHPAPFPGRSRLQAVPHTAVDALLSQHADTASAAAYTIFLMRLPVQERPYAYSYGGESREACLGSLYTGADRYMWLDLTAGPVEYGPSVSGEGAAQPPHGSPALADLAALLWSASQFLLRPALRVPAYFDPTISVHLFHIHSDVASSSASASAIDWNAIESAFRTSSPHSLLFSQQQLRFRRFSLDLMQCPLCVSAIWRSTRSYTARYLFENHTMFVTEYLDSKQLHYLLSDYRDELARAAGVPAELEHERVVPVYVLDLGWERPLLLDRFHQSVAFRDMAIAVRTAIPHWVSEYSCNGRHMSMAARQLERPIVGSLLQSIWGVSPSHVSWSHTRNSTMVDYLWSVGRTPFGPFGHGTALSFAQTDAALRNVVLSTLNATVASALSVFESVAAHGGEKRLLGPSRLPDFNLRWNLLRYKIDKALSAISHFDFDEALYFVKSSDFDLFEMHNLLYLGASEMDASLVCFKDPPFPWGSVLSFALIMFAFTYACFKRDKLFRSKSKQF